MGYSCAAKANLVLEALQEITKALGIQTSNGMPNGGFWEIGREQADGAITGTVWKPWPQDRERVIKAGSFKIDSEGKIVRFPGLSAAQRNLAQINGTEKYKALYGNGIFSFKGPDNHV